MAARICSFYFLGAMLILCFANVSSLTKLIDETPMKLASDDNRDMPDNLVGDFSFAGINSDSVNAIYQFGDSIADTGNYKSEKPYATFSLNPYGVTYFHKPTGRCSDGRLMIDFFAEYLKLSFLNAYLNKDADFTHGANFAVVGATALDASVLVAKNIIPYVTNHSLSVQLGWFKSHLDSTYPDISVRKRELAKALFFMGEFGGNDYNFAFFQGKTLRELFNLVPEVIQVISQGVEELIGLGSTKIVVPGNFPIGCMTVYLATFKTNDTTKYDDLKCLKYLNDFSVYHNQQVQKAIENLRQNHPGITIVYMDYYKAMKLVLRRAASIGFDKDGMYKTCCGTGGGDYNFDSGKSCGSAGVSACENPLTRVNWDGFHLTEHAYQAMANSLTNII